MTTKVTVDAHAGWPVEVVTLIGESTYRRESRVVRVEAGTTQDFYVHSSCSILSIVELKKEL